MGDGSRMINTAMAARGLIPPEFTCSVCRGTFDRELCADKDVTPEFYKALREAAGGHVCFECKGRFALCDSCGVPSLDGLDFNDPRGECGDCARCRAEYDEDAASRGTW